MDPENLPKFVYLHKNHKYKLKLGFYAAPSNPKLFSNAIKDELSKLKFTYCSNLNGLVMGFGKISSNELIQADIRHSISVAVNVDVFIFRPPVGSIIEAIVNQTSDNHVSCLVHKLFNVSIVRPEHEPYDKWAGSKVKKNDKINVKVVSFDLAKKLPHITGDIVDDETNELSNIKHDQDNYCGKSPSKLSVSCFNRSNEKNEKTETTRTSILSSSDKSSDENNFNPSHSQQCNNKYTEKSPQNHATFTNSQQIKSPLFSSTPVSNSDHTLCYINLIKNKQIDELSKHLSKNSIDKQRSLNSIKSSHEIGKTNLSKSSKIIKTIKNNDNNDNELDLPIDSVYDIDHLDGSNQIYQQDSLQSDSGISDVERKQVNCSLQKSSSNLSNKFTETLKKYSNTKFSEISKNVDLILHSLSPNKNKSETNVKNHNLLSESNTKHKVDEENTVFTEHDLNNSDNSEEEIFDNCNNSNTLAVNKPYTLRLSTKRVEDTTLNDSKQETKTQIENKTVKKMPSHLISMISDSESSSNSEHIKLPLKDTNHKINLDNTFKDKTIDSFPKPKKSISNSEYSSSSDDEIYTKLKHNISNIEDSKPVIENIKYQTFDELFSSDDESDSSTSSTHIQSLKLFEPNATKINENNILDMNDSNITTNKLLSKENINKYKKTKKVNDKSTLQLSNSCNENSKLTSNLVNKKDQIIDQILEVTYNIDTSSNDEYKLLNQEVCNKMPTLNVSKSVLNKDVSSPIIKSSIEISTSSEDEVINFKKSKDINHLKKVDKTNNIINQVLTSLKNEDKKLNTISSNHMSSIPFNNSDKIKNINELIKDKPKIINTKNILIESKSSTKETKPNIFSTLNITKQENPLQLEKQHTTSDSTEDEIDLITNILKQRKFIKTKKKKMKKNELNLTIKNDKLKNNKEPKTTSEEKREKAINESIMTDNNIIKSKKKKPKDSNDLLLDNLVDDIVNPLNSFEREKKHLIIETTNDLPQDKNASMITDKLINDILKSKNKRSKHSTNLPLDNLVNDIEDPLNNFAKRKKKNNSITETNDLSQDKDASLLTDKLINDILKSKKKISKHSTDFLPLDNLSNEIKKPLNSLTTRKKKNNSITETNDLSQDKNASLLTDKLINDILKSKKKISKHSTDLPLDNLGNEIKDPLNSLTTRKKKNNLLQDKNESIIRDELIKNILKSKRKRSKHSTDLALYNLANDIEDPLNNFAKRKKKSHNSIIETNDSSQDKNASLITEKLINNIMKSKKKKPKDTNDSVLNSLANDIDPLKSLTMRKKKNNNLIIETNDSSQDKNASLITDELINNIMKSKKKKPKDTNDSVLDSLVNDIEDPLKSLTMRKKKNNNLIIETKDSSQDKNVSLITDELINNIMKSKKKKPKDTNDSVLDSLANDIEDPLNNFTKIKKKNGNSITETNNLLQDKNKSIIRDELINNIIKSKKKKHKDTNNSVLDNLSNDINDSLKSVTMKKKKNNNLIIETNDSSQDKNASLITDELINNIIKSKKKKPKDTNNSVLDCSANDIKNPLKSPTKRKKINNNLIIDINDSSKDKNASLITDELIYIIKSKKKKPNDSNNSHLDNLSNDINDPLNSSIIRKKKKRNSNLLIETNDSIKDKNSNIKIVDVKKKKKSKHNNCSNVKDLTMIDNNRQYSDLSMKLKQNNEIVTVKNTCIDVTKQKEKKNNIKEIKSDQIQYETHGIATEKLNDHLVHKKNKSLKEKMSKKKKMSSSDIRNFIISQKSDFTTNLDNLYHDLNLNLNEF